MGTLAKTNVPRSNDTNKDIKSRVLRVGFFFTVLHGWVSVASLHLRFQWELNCTSATELDSSSSARLLGDHQKVPDPVPAARGRRRQRDRGHDTELHLGPAGLQGSGLQRRRLHPQVLCLQLSGNANAPRDWAEI